MKQQWYWKPVPQVTCGTTLCCQPTSASATNSQIIKCAIQALQIRRCLTQMLIWDRETANPSKHACACRAHHSQNIDCLAHLFSKSTQTWLTWLGTVRKATARHLLVIEAISRSLHSMKDRGLLTHWWRWTWTSRPLYSLNVKSRAAGKAYCCKGSLTGSPSSLS